MSDQSPDHSTEPMHVWLPPVLLKFLTFVVFCYILYEVTVGLGDQDLSTKRVTVIVASMAGLLLLLGVERLVSLRLSSGGMEATLEQAKAQALGRLNKIEDRDIAQAARAQILHAHSPQQVQASVTVAVELNADKVIDRVKEAISQKRKIYVRYRPETDSPVEAYLIAPFDIQPGRNPATQASDYLWGYSYEHQSLISLRLGLITGVELSEEPFDPTRFLAGLKRPPRWNLPRAW
jgi:hypothetical protein